MMQNNVKDNPKRAEELVAQFNTDGNEIKILFPNACNLQAVSCDLTKYATDLEVEIATFETNLANAKTDKAKGVLVNPALVQLFDGTLPVINIDRKKLYDHIGTLMGTYQNAGIYYNVPRIEYSLEIDLKVEHDLRAKGDVKGLIFWIDGKPLRS